MPGREAPARRDRALVGIALVGLVLRLIPITWGAGLRPHEGFYHADEPKVIATTADFPRSYPAPRILIYGTAVQDLLGTLLLPARALWAWGLRPAPFEHYGHFVLLAQRGLHVLLGALTIVVLYWLGLVLFDRRTALLGAALLAVSPAPVLHSALATLDAPIAFLATLVLLLTLKAFASGQRIDFVWLGLTGGLLLGTKIAGVVAGAAPLVLLVRTSSMWRRLALALGIAVALFLITTPAVLLDSRSYLAFMAEQHSTWVVGRPHDLLSVLAAQARSFRLALSAPVALAAVASLVLTVVQSREPARLSHVAIAAVVLAHVVFWRGFAPIRFALILAPALCLYAAGLVILLQAASSPALRVAGLGLASVLLASSSWATLGGLRQRIGDDPRTQAARYIAAHVPQGASLALAPSTERDPWTGHPWRYPRLAEGSCAITPLLDRPEYIVTTSYVMKGIAESVEAEDNRASAAPGEHDAGRGYRGRSPSVDELGFYRALLAGSAGYHLEMTWKPAFSVPIEFAAPEIRLYRRRTPELTSKPGDDHANDTGSDWSVGNTRAVCRPTRMGVAARAAPRGS